MLGTVGGLPSGAGITGNNWELAEPDTYFFSEIWYPWIGLTGQKGEGRTVCVRGCCKGFRGF